MSDFTDALLFAIFVVCSAQFIVSVLDYKVLHKLTIKKVRCKRAVSNETKV